ncbi:MAG: DEAD/DEAH box helicase [Planctomycetes bacterium]|nr:DEAD/DEAH box helicase [Planctomycetota bacterium]
MSLEEWQRQLRRQFGREQKYTLKNLGEQPLFSEFEVTNPQSRRTYRVHIRGLQPGDNFCTCPDFATNTLGTCKHIEFTLAKIERRRGARAELRAGWQPPYSEIFLHYGARREVRFRPGSTCSVKLARLASAYFGADGTLLADAFLRFGDFLAEASKLDDEDLRCHNDVLAFIAELRDAERRKQRVEEAFPRGILSPAFKDLLKINLYDYQREGVLFATRTGRCLIGDDMGLGKTVQAIAVAEVMAHLFGVERVLVICPTSLKHQWQREIERFSKRTVQTISGLRAGREKGFATKTFFKITNYDPVHRDLDLIAGWSPDLVILDEAQRIKNWSTRTARSVKQVASPYALVLTGTPLENRLEELISIVQFVDQYRLGPTFRLLHEHQLRDEVGKVTGYRNLDQIGKTLAPILVRRHKDEVADQLPGRIDNNFFVPMTALQRKHHDENLEIVARIVYKWRTYRFLSEADQRRLMIALQRMRMSCDSSYLVDHVSDHGVKAGEAVTLLEELFEQPGAKVVIFSQWVRMHELLSKRLKKRGWDHVLFQGSVPSAKRKDLIDRFRDDPNCRAFLSTDTGGTGLNLQHASMVINMDLPWNPAVLEQRIGRVHRLGQRNVVRVVNFIAQGTIEEGMLGVLKFKKSLFAGVLDGGEKDVFLGGSRLNKFMETVERMTGAIPEVTIEDADAAYGAERAPEPELPGPVNGRPHGRRGQKPPPRPTPPPPEETPAPPSAPATDPWSGLLQAGMALLQQVVGASKGASSPEKTKPDGKTRAPAAPSLLARDEKTGETFLKLPVPPPDMLEQLIRGVGSLLEGLRK